MSQEGPLLPLLLSFFAMVVAYVIWLFLGATRVSEAGHEAGVVTWYQSSLISVIFLVLVVPAIIGYMVFFVARSLNNG